MNNAKKIPLVLSASFLMSYVGYGGWVFSAFKEMSEFSTKPARKVCYIKNSNGTTYYTSLDYALNVASENGINDEIYVIPQEGTELCQPVEIRKSHTIKSGDSLKLPYDSETTKPSDYTGSAVIDSSNSNVNSYRRTLVEILDGSQLIIESGASMIIGGVFNTKGVTGKYTELDLDTDSSIVCSGTMEVYGYIKEKNGKYSSKTDGKELNENDQNRYINFTSTGSLTCPLAIKDAQSGGVMTSLNDSGVCPTNEFSIQAIQTYTTFEYGSKAVALARMTAASQNMERRCGFIGKDGPTSRPAENCIFYLQSGSSLSMEYVPSKPGITNTEAGTDYSKFVVNGKVNLGSLYLDVTVTTIDTTKYYFPLSYLMNLYIENGAEFVVDHQFKIYPGSSLLIKNGGKLSLNSDMVVYTCSDLANLNSSTSFIYPVSKIGADGRFIDNGAFVLSNQGHFGGKINHTNPGYSSIDFSNAESTNLAAVSIEGTTKIAINKQATGIFKTSRGFKEALIAAKQIASSAKEGSVFYWKGNYELTVNVSVELTKKYDNSVYGYTISYADDANGTNAAFLSAENSTDIKTYQASNQKYIRFAIKRTAGIQVDFGDGAKIEIDQSKWYKVGDEDIRVYITPFEGVSVDITTTGNSGAGHVVYTLYESEQENGTFEQIGSNSTGKLSVNVIKGRYFKFTTYSQNGYYFTTKTVLKNGTKIGEHGNNSNLGNDIVYLADGNYKFDFGWNFCIAEWTKVLLADGTYKQAGEIKTGDMVISFNHENGKFEPNRVIGNDDISKQAETYNVVHLEFSNGKSTDFIYEHGYFDKTLNKYVYLHEDDFADYINHDFVFYEDGSVTVGKLIRGSISKIFTRLASPATANHLNLIVDDMLSIGGGLDGLFNIFEYDLDTLAFDKEKMNADIAEYGLLGYESFEKYFPKEIYDLLPCKYLGVSIGKGLITWDIFEGYVNKWKDQLLENLK